jgi:hypothetical protein
MIKVVVHMDTFFKPCSEEFHEFTKKVVSLAENYSEVHMLRHECDIHDDKEACELELQRLERQSSLTRSVEDRADEFVKCVGRMLELAEVT